MGFSQQGMPPQHAMPQQGMPQHGGMNQDPWAAHSPADGGPPWGGPPGDGNGPGEHNETALLSTDYSPAPHGGYQNPYQNGFQDGFQNPGQPRQERANKPLVYAVAALVAVALIAVVFVMWPDGGKKDDPGSTPAAVKSSSTPNNPAARQQAAAVNSLLNASAASRGELGRALVAAKRCKGLPTAINGMQRVAQQRQNQLAKARALKVDALANGTQLRSHLAKSIQFSLNVDQSYLTWAQSSQGCKGRPKADQNYRRGAQLSNQATESKQRFATLWAPVARQQKLPARTANQF